jgi:hypothetical protein
MQITMMDRDDYLRLQREMTKEAEKAIGETLTEFHDDNETLPDFYAEVASLRAQIEDLQRDSSLQSEALRMLITNVLSGGER